MNNAAVAMACAVELRDETRRAFHARSREALNEWQALPGILAPAARGDACRTIGLV